MKLQLAGVALQKSIRTTSFGINCFPVEKLFSFAVQRTNFTLVHNEVHIGHDPLKFKSTRTATGENECWSHHLRVASERCDAQNERDEARAAQLRRSSVSVAAPSQLHYNININT